MPKTTQTITVRLNGTDSNPFHAFGLKCNPFPQWPKAEYQAAVMRLQSLGADPIPKDNPEAYIRRVLDGFDTAFVSMIVSRFKAGEMVEFSFSFECDE